MGRMLVRAVTGLVGAALIAIGLAGIVLPILPGWALIIAGLLVLAREFPRARGLVDRIRRPLEERGILKRRQPIDLS